MYVYNYVYIYVCIISGSIRYVGTIWIDNRNHIVLII